MFGDGFHNYHVFPSDYRSGEFSGYSGGSATLFIDCMAKIGWAYDLKTVAPEMVKRRIERTGDGTHKVWKPKDKDEINLKQNSPHMTYMENTNDAKRI